MKDRRILHLLWLLLFFGCAVDAAAGRYRYVAGRLVSCIRATTTRWQRRECVEESRTRCKAAGLEPNCAEDRFEEERRE